MPTKVFLSTTLMVVVLIATAPKSFASGFALLEQSGSRLGNAFAGSAATSEDASTLFFNPAGLVNLPTRELVVAASGIYINTRFLNSGSQAAALQPLGTSGGNAGGFNFVPSFYLSAPIADRLAVGIGINAPFGLKTEYDDQWIGRYQALKSEIKTVNINPSFAFRVNDWLSIGMGANHQRLQAELTNAVNYSAVIAQGVQQLVLAGQLPMSSVPALLAANAGVEGQVQVRGHDHVWGYNAGLLMENRATETKIGLAYRSAMDYRVRGAAQFTAPLITQQIGAAIVAGVSAPGGALASGPVFVEIRLPASAIASFSQHVTPQVELLADISWTEWSSIQELRVVRDQGATLSVAPYLWEDTWRFALGGIVQLSPALKLRAGAAYDQTPVPHETRTPRLADSSRIWAAVGAHWLPTESLAIDVGYAHLFSDPVPLNSDAGNSLAYGLLNGRQHAKVDILSVQVGYRF